MVLKMGAIAGAEQALGRLLQKELPKKTAYSLTRLQRMAGTELEQWHKKRNALIEELGEKGSDGKPGLTPGTPAFEDFVKHVSEYADVDIELGWSAVTLDELGDVTISPADLSMLLGTFIVDPDAKKDEPKTDEPAPPAVPAAA